MVSVENKNLLHWLQTSDHEKCDELYSSMGESCSEQGWSNEAIVKVYVQIAQETSVKINRLSPEEIASRTRSSDLLCDSGQSENSCEGSEEGARKPPEEAFLLNLPSVGYLDDDEDSIEISLPEDDEASDFVSSDNRDKDGEQSKIDTRSVLQNGKEKEIVSVASVEESTKILCADDKSKDKEQPNIEDVSQKCIEGSDIPVIIFQKNYDKSTEISSTYNVNRSEEQPNIKEDSLQIRKEESSIAVFKSIEVHKESSETGKSYTEDVNKDNGHSMNAAGNVLKNGKERDDGFHQLEEGSESKSVQEIEVERTQHKNDKYISTQCENNLKEANKSTQDPFVSKPTASKSVQEIGVENSQHKNDKYISTQCEKNLEDANKSTQEPSVGKPTANLTERTCAIDGANGLKKNTHNLISDKVDSNHEARERVEHSNLQHQQSSAAEENSGQPIGLDKKKDLVENATSNQSFNNHDHLHQISVLQEMLTQSILNKNLRRPVNKSENKLEHKNFNVGVYNTKQENVVKSKFNNFLDNRHIREPLDQEMQKNSNIQNSKSDGVTLHGSLKTPVSNSKVFGSKQFKNNPLGCDSMDRIKRNLNSLQTNLNTNPAVNTPKDGKDSTERGEYTTRSGEAMATGDEELEVDINQLEKTRVICTPWPLNVAGGVGYKPGSLETNKKLLLEPRRKSVEETIREFTSQVGSLHEKVVAQKRAANPPEQEIHRKSKARRVSCDALIGKSDSLKRKVENPISTPGEGNGESKNATLKEMLAKKNKNYKYSITSSNTTELVNNKQKAEVKTVCENLSERRFTGSFNTVQQQMTHLSAATGSYHQTHSSNSLGKTTTSMQQRYMSPTCGRAAQQNINQSIDSRSPVVLQPNFNAVCTDLTKSKEKGKDAAEGSDRQHSSDLKVQSASDMFREIPQRSTNVDRQVRDCSFSRVMINSTTKVAENISQTDQNQFSESSIPPSQVPQVSQSQDDQTNEKIFDYSSTMFVNYFETPGRKSYCIPKDIKEDLMKFLISQNKNVQFVPNKVIVHMYLAFYVGYFTEELYPKINKCAELLHLAIADFDRRKEHKDRANGLTSETLRMEEMNRAEKDYQEMLSIRCIKFTEIFLPLAKCFECCEYAMMVTLYFRITLALLNIDIENLKHIFFVRSLIISLIIGSRTRNILPAILKTLNLPDNSFQDSYNFVKRCLVILAKLGHSHSDPSLQNILKFAEISPFSVTLEPLLTDFSVNRWTVAADQRSTINIRGPDSSTTPNFQNQLRVPFENSVVSPNTNVCNSSTPRQINYPSANSSRSLGLTNERTQSQVQSLRQKTPPCQVSSTETMTQTQRINTQPSNHTNIGRSNYVPHQLPIQQAGSQMFLSTQSPDSREADSSRPPVYPTVTLQSQLLDQLKDKIGAHLMPGVQRLSNTADSPSLRNQQPAPKFGQTSNSSRNMRADNPNVPSPQQGLFSTPQFCQSNECGQSATVVCSLCKNFYYCNRACQRQDWYSKHSIECTGLTTPHPLQGSSSKL